MSKKRVGLAAVFNEPNKLSHVKDIINQQVQALHKFFESKNLFFPEDRFICEFKPSEYGGCKLRMFVEYTTEEEDKIRKSVRLI
jgi:hypothetical protein